MAKARLLMAEQCRTRFVVVEEAGRALNFRCNSAADAGIARVQDASSGWATVGSSAIRQE
ncbi:MAG TPA: hypothetical protein VFG30_36025 [Polyangiales bacterium]|nr:hypothetical protein [Polyangiales bacterium]